MDSSFSTIAFVVPYFGKFNAYFQLWLNSCAANPTIDWLLFTDDRRSYNYPPNVHVAYTDLSEIKRRAESTLGCQVCLESPYKLCDFKPFYGVIFARELKEYDFWGYCDVDLIWGDIRRFLPESLLAANDKIFSYGHCTILRNTNVINLFFELSTKGVVPWRKVVSEPYIFLYDEADQTNGIFEDRFPSRFHCGLAAFDAKFSSRPLRPSKGTVKFMQAVNTDYLFRWNKGRLTGLCMTDGDNIREQDFMYVHLQKRKMRCEIPQLNSSMSFLILHNGFIKDEPITTGNFNLYVPKKRFLPYRFRDHITHAFNIIFDNYKQKPYFRGRISYWFDNLFGRADKYDYRFR